ncbi:hypothetical protein ALP05_04386 [Pseudomonas caricapapayae]|uniref:Uncharacterized protein n=1 Tax=Pseudomonas caricapapayae TaxID=46678 RepID=A0A3M6FEP2_9PSED|nr:hypothetical protein [Pseudomonas caricapapayae]RMV79109.1 hypothetical protein ALP05_04386 [Pseudomonas caricapapayae]
MANDTMTHSRSITDVRGCVDALFNAACKQGTTYEAVVHSVFCESLRSEFGEDECGTAASAFTYARETYGYQDEAEQQAQLEADAEQGICCHGLDWMTCPAGCFED